MGFAFIGRGHLERVQWTDHCPTGRIKQCFTMGPVINKKRFVQISGTEMAAKKRKDSVFRFYFTAQYAVEF